MAVSLSMVGILRLTKDFLSGKFIHIDFARIKELMYPPVWDDPSSCTFSSVEEGSDQSEEASTQFTVSLLRQDLIT